MRHHIGQYGIACGSPTNDPTMELTKNHVDVDCPLCIAALLAHTWGNPLMPSRMEIPQGLAQPDRDCMMLIDYTNYRGQRRWRMIKPAYMWFGATPFHKDRQWLIRATCMEDGEWKDFAWAAIHRARPVA